MKLRAISLSIPYSPLLLGSSSPTNTNTNTNVQSLFFTSRRPTFRLEAYDCRIDPSLPVDVIGIGSRKDALIDFCLRNHPPSSRQLRFWTIHMTDSLEVQLLQRCYGTDEILKTVELPQSLHPCPPAVILVASAGHGLDHITAIELLKGAKSAGGLVVAILLKPFSFEGQKRREEVDNLVSKLRECSHLYIVVEADSLLKAEVETLAEALESANNAVFLAMNTISVLMSEMHLKFLNSPDGPTKEVKPFELVKLLGSYGEAKVGFGAGYNLKSAITQAVFHCPFHCGGLKDLNGLVIFTLTSSCAVEESDMSFTISSFRRFTECTTEIICSRIHEPDLEPNLIVTTLLIVGCNGKKIPQKNSFLSSLTLHFPFLHSLLGRDHLEPNGNPSATLQYGPSVNGALESRITNLGETELEPSSRLSSHENTESEKVESLEVSFELVSGNYNQANEGIQKEQHGNWNAGPGFHIAHLWAKERAALVGANKIDRLDAVTLPVGVKSYDPSSSSPPYSECKPSEFSDGTRAKSLGIVNFDSRYAFADASLEAITEIYSNASAPLKARKLEDSGKHGLLSARAASMLESEGASPKTWTPIMEIPYKGGIYRGQCQGDLPEGKGRLTFMDGSFYDGIWRTGKRSGSGTFCHCNGDVFLGAWRDDFMHGKGWYYFHTGDRWFANFWKGKANGEGRFHSQNGSAFFGFFQNGWRHGEGLHIDADGSRWTEIWNEGVLISRTRLNVESDSE